MLIPMNMSQLYIPVNQIFVMMRQFFIYTNRILVKLAIWNWKFSTGSDIQILCFSASPVHLSIVHPNIIMKTLSPYDWWFQVIAQQANTWKSHPHTGSDMLYPESWPTLAPAEHFCFLSSQFCVSSLIFSPLYPVSHRLGMTSISITTNPFLCCQSIGLPWYKLVFFQ